MDMDKYPDNLIDPEKNHTIRKAIVNLLIWLDVKINDYILFGKTETISARMGRSIQSDHPSAVAVVLCDFLDVVQRDHCKNAYQALLDRQAGKETDFKG